MLRILIADDHEIVRRGVRAELTQRSDWEICGEAHNGSEAVRLARELKPDVVVMDHSMPELNGVEATRYIRRELPGTEVLIFTMHEKEQVIREALAAGARGYVLKTDRDSHLVSAVAALARHHSYFTDTISKTLHDAFLRSGSRKDKSYGLILTDREREIVQMLTEGRSNREIAVRLQISIKTVETHRASAMRKLNINSIVALAHYAIRNQIVEA
ncbi:MAG TPA: response regulator transcription factor [Pyrinomonadaceae bacterium]|nr:response regulator transcription factor [Pyrinomonadaceae bacterium]